MGGRSLASLDDLEDADGKLLALDRELVHLTAEEVRFDPFVHGLRDEGFCAVGLIRAFEPGRKVDGIADRGEVHTVLCADRTEDHGTGVDTDADGHDVGLGGDSLLFLLGHALADAEARTHGIEFLVGALEHGHNLVADKFIDIAMVRDDDRGLEVEVMIEHLDDLLGAHAFA